MFIEGEGHDIIWHHPSPGCQMFCDIVSSWHRDNVQWQPPGGDDDICSHPVTSNCNQQSPGAPCIFWVEIIVFLTSRMGRAWTINVITQLRTHNNILGSSLCPRGKPQMTACSQTISPISTHDHRLSPSWWHTAIISAHCYRLISISIPCFDNRELMMGEMRWPALLSGQCTWMMKIEDQSGFY